MRGWVVEVTLSPLSLCCVCVCTAAPWQTTRSTSLKLLCFILPLLHPLCPRTTLPICFPLLPFPSAPPPGTPATAPPLSPPDLVQHEALPHHHQPHPGLSLYGDGLSTEADDVATGSSITRRHTNLHRGVGTGGRGGGDVKAGVS